MAVAAAPLFVEVVLDELLLELFLALRLDLDRHPGQVIAHTPMATACEPLGLCEVRGGLEGERVVDVHPRRAIRGRLQGVELGEERRSTKPDLLGEDQRRLLVGECLDLSEHAEESIAWRLGEPHDRVVDRVDVRTRHRVPVDVGRPVVAGEEVAEERKGELAEGCAGIDVVRHVEMAPEERSHVADLATSKQCGYDAAPKWGHAKSSPSRDGRTSPRSCTR